MVEYKLYYFNLKGRAELARLIFAAAGQQYEDIRFEREQWPEYKQKSPLGQAPYLEVIDNGKTFQLGQSITIARYLARKFGLAGKGDEEQAEVESYGDQISDIVDNLIKIHFESDETKKLEMRKKFLEETLPSGLKVLEGKVVQNGSGFLAASGLTWADLYLISILDWIYDYSKTVLDSFQHLKKLEENIRGHARISEWLAKRPVTAM
nr:glutathione S-transferase sigma 1-1 [Brachionus rubens]